MAKPRKLFISHAAADKPLVEAFVDLLESGIGVPSNEIFCSSLKTQSIKPGADFVSSIREHLDDATCVLALISEAYYASAFCMCELGGTWLQSKSFLPVLVPPVGHDNLKAVLNGVQVSKIGTEIDLDEIRDELEERLGIEIHGTPRWTSKKAKFLNDLPALLKAIEFKGPVERRKYKKALDEIEEYRKAYEALEKDRAKQETLIEDLKKQKDRDAVRKVVSKHSTAQEEFERLVDAADSALSPLSRSTREALYYRARSEPYAPPDDDWDDVQAASEHGELSVDDDNRQVHLDNDHAEVRRAMKALDALEEWLSACPQPFSEWYDAKYKGARPSLGLRQFWKEHF